MTRKQAEQARLVFLARLVSLVSLLMMSCLPGTTEGVTPVSATAEQQPATATTDMESNLATAVDLYGVFEVKVTNDGSYDNPFDYNEIELQATFRSPSGQETDFFGFFAGDGNGGQTGNVWKLRFMPDEVGTWEYAYRWTDGTEGGSGSFAVVDTGLPGPLQVASDNSWYFEDARGVPFDARPYDLHHVGPDGAEANSAFPEATWDSASSVYISVMERHFIPAGYNMTMVDSPSSLDFSRNWWWQDQDDEFDIEVWDDYEKILEYCLKHEVYLFPFDGMQQQTARMRQITDELIRYMVARFAPYASYMGYSATYEWTEVWGSSEADEVMSTVDKWHPFPTLLSIHDHSDARFEDWMGFSMRQLQSRTIFDGNCRACGDHGGVDDPLDDMPIIGSEDIWENEEGSNGNPRNPTEVRRGAWGIMMAGVMPLYSEWFKAASDPGDMPGEAEVLRMFDFFYSQTHYRRHEQLNHLVSDGARQIASGIPGEEYVVYDEDGGSITIDLSEADGKLSVVWYDPKTGKYSDATTVSGGGSRTFDAPFDGDAVLHIQSMTEQRPGFTAHTYLPLTISR